MYHLCLANSGRTANPFLSIHLSELTSTTISADPYKPAVKLDWVALASCPSYLPSIQTTYPSHRPCNCNVTMKGLLPMSYGISPNGRRSLVNFVEVGIGSNVMGGLRDVEIVSDMGSVACILTPYPFEPSDGNAPNSTPGWAQYSSPLFLNLNTDIDEMNTDVPVLQTGNPMPCFNNYLIIPEPTVDVYVPFDSYSSAAHVTSTQERTTAHHDVLESPPWQDLSARAPNVPYLLLPDDLPSPHRIQRPSEMMPPLRLHVGSPALASAKRKIRRHEAKFFCVIAGCGHDFTTKQNLKSMFNVITVFSLFV
ncbi:uncharacterized protein LACBIDRAFT_331435 [Laccaria bicolor S238N-H82]|uniref:Predicted protein n=1 Tax=Laccaria bicolor (strain S238N-H82 / ATCC MYA-4686) TaxID=486041 RepID=B0DPG8_LACBS|nr:uncharacterized protein LACBIDRAFT_331435 [Laccaria bicolor S238N-H82]EDR03450.1 predicted protein [Laccaria bicolor S238N-H82]|eukprot:XP_001885906.1 predicted protein [Laccaria bicolor S238N-H82]